METDMRSQPRPRPLPSLAEWPINRRRFVLGASGLVGGSLLGGLAGCGGGGDDGDPIWGPSGAATAIVDSLVSVAQSSFPARDFTVTDYGAVQCTVIDAVNPYTDAAKSPLSAGSDKTHAP